MDSFGKTMQQILTANTQKKKNPTKLDSDYPKCSLQHTFYSIKFSRKTMKIIFKPSEHNKNSILLHKLQYCHQIISASVS